jgi:hypothetical protein
MIRNRIKAHRRVRARDLDPDMEVEGELLDVTDAEARALLLSIDLLAALAEPQSQLQERLLEWTPTITPDLRAAWEAAAAAVLAHQYLVLITCGDEKHQVELLNRIIAEHLECRALQS